jgi:hypothetical protein
MHTFETPAAPTIELRTGSGRVTVSAVDGVTTTVELVPVNHAAVEVIAEATVEQRGDSIVIDLPRRRGFLRQGPAVDVTVTCPPGSDLRFESDSADLQTTGALANVTAATGSGDLTLGDATGRVRLKAGSGAVSVGQVDGQLQVTTGSGDIRFGELAGRTTTKTGSGNVEVGVLHSDLETKTGSGHLTVRRAASGSVRANGASGSISVGIEEGTAAWLDLSTLSGRVRQELGESGAPSEDQRRVGCTAHDPPQARSRPALDAEPGAPRSR